MSVYDPTDWINDTEPAINDDNLNHLERGVEDAHKEIEEIAIGNTSVYDAATADKARFIPAATQTVVGGIKVHNIVDSSSGDITSVITAPQVTEVPGPIINLKASDNLPGVVVFSFAHAADALYHNLYQDDILIASNIQPGYRFRTTAGTWDFRVKGVNLFGEGQGVEDRGTAKIIPTEPPAEILDFTASDDKMAKIVMEWTDHGDVTRFDLYEDSTRLVEDVLPGHDLITGEYTGEYSVRAFNLLGDTYSNDDEGIAHGNVPVAVENFLASDVLTASIEIQFDYIPQAVSYDLYRDGSLYRGDVYSGMTIPSYGGTWDFYVRATNNHGTSASIPDSGTSVDAKFPPGPVNNFHASDDMYGRVQIEFSEAIDASQYNLYADDFLVASEVFPGFVHTTAASTAQYRVEAVNIKGSTYSDYESGTSLAPFTAAPVVITDFTASDDLTNAIQVNFTEHGDATRYDLYRDGAFYQARVKDGQRVNCFGGTWDFHVVASNPMGSTPCDPSDEGTAAEASSEPSKIQDFLPSTDLEVQIYFTFTPADRAARHDLYKDDVPVLENVSSGDTYTTEAGSAMYSVMAVNLKGSVESNEETGTALEATIPPDIPINFDASDNTVPGPIVMTWDTADKAESYNLYKGDIGSEVLEQSGMTGNRYEYPSNTTGTWSFCITAENEHGETEYSTHNDGSSVEPVADLDPAVVHATDDEVGYVDISWTDAQGEADDYDLEEDYSIVQIGLTLASSPVRRTFTDDTKVYRIRSNKEGTDSVYSLEDMGTSVLAPPTAINNFSATNGSSCQNNQITLTWSEGANTDSVDLLDGMWQVMEYNVHSPYIDDGLGDDLTRYYGLRSNGPGGTATSNDATGNTCENAPDPIAAGSVTIGYDSYTATGSGVGTVVIASGQGTFTAPVGVTTGDLYMVGAGGGGGGGHGGEESDLGSAGEGGNGGLGGGYGLSVSQPSRDISGSNSISIGLGGTGGIGGEHGDDSGSAGGPGDPGIGGGDSVFSSSTSSGGSGGAGGPGHGSTSAGEVGDTGSGSYGGTGGSGGSNAGDGGLGGTGGTASGGGGGGGGAGGTSGDENGGYGGDGGPGGNGEITISWEAVV